MKLIRRFLSFLLAASIAASIHLTVLSPAAAAAPRLMMAYGPPLTRSVLFSDWHEIAEFMPDEAMNVTPDELSGRAYITFALFWGIDWVRYADSRRSLAELRPEQGNQQARFYPATSDAPAIFWSNSVGSQGPFVHRLESRSLEILAKHGIPSSLQASLKRGLDSPILALGETPIQRMFALDGQQATQVAAVMRFIQAYNAGHLDEALALLDKGIGWSDCDYTSGTQAVFRGKAKVAEWLRQRIADHDQLTVGAMFNGNPDPTSGANVVGVDFRRRTSDWLKQKGFRDGLEARLAAKVVFTELDPVLIAGFAAGSTKGCNLDTR